MTIRHSVECDAHGCRVESPLFGMPDDFSSEALRARGWWVDTRPRRSALTGGTYEATHHFCSDDCYRAWIADVNEQTRRELIRR